MAACLVVASGSALAQTTVEIVATRDNTIYEDMDMNSNGAGTSMIAGVIARATSPRRALLAFDDLSVIPAGADVLEVRLRMEMINSQAGPTAMTLHEALANWGEADSAPLGGPGQGGRAEPGDATWLHREFDQVFWDTPGGDFDPSPLATTEVGVEGTYEWSSAALADLVEAWARGDTENRGLIVLGDESTLRTTKHFSTREGSSPPTLIVTFGEGGTDPFTINQGIAGAWFEPATAGQGLLIDIEPETRFIFIAWFTFEAPSGSKVGSADQRWLTAQGSYEGRAAVDLPIFNTTGGAFDTVQAVASEQVGLLTISFDSCTAGTVDYTLDEGLAGSIAIERVIPGTEVLCEALTGMR